ncbi:MAG TPA: amino acid racemase [Sphingomicrobium sp.]|nr:amino acid racemase [Sphingomicrobium sp.]
MRHIGILAHSYEGASLCYRAVCLEGIRRLGPHFHPEITLTGVAMHHMMAAYDRDDHAAVRELFQHDVDKLVAAGADFFILPDNTAHIALELLGRDFALPGLHIGEVVAARAEQAGFRKVGILGTRWTMSGPVYPGAFGRRGIKWEIPDEDDRKLINDVIFDELCLGKVTDESRAAYVTIIDTLATRGCDSVALVCTEIPLLVSPVVSPLPTLDSTRLLAEAAVEVALGDRPIPAWRGGPL